VSLKTTYWAKIAVDSQRLVTGLWALTDADDIRSNANAAAAKVRVSLFRMQILLNLLRLCDA
jgi:hypothetical protein